MLALGLNVVSGWTGQPHLGVAAYAGVGAYVSAWLSVRLGISPWACLPFSIAAAAAFAGCTGLAAARLSADALALWTLAMAVVFESALTYAGSLGGPLGLLNLPAPSAMGAPLTAGGMAVVGVALVAGAAAAAVRLERSWLGLAWKGVREDETAAQSLGVCLWAHKAAAFAAAGAAAGASGWLSAHFLRSASPRDFGFAGSIPPLAMILLGGTRPVAGPLAGAAALTLLLEASRFAETYRGLIYGVVLIWAMRARYQGLAPARRTSTPSATLPT